jgi:hypothetical protein
VTKHCRPSAMLCVHDLRLIVLDTTDAVACNHPVPDHNASVARHLQLSMEACTRQMHCSLLNSQGAGVTLW